MGEVRSPPSQAILLLHDAHLKTIPQNVSWTFLLGMAEFRRDTTRTKTNIYKKHAKWYNTWWLQWRTSQSQRERGPTTVSWLMLAVWRKRTETNYIAGTESGTGYGAFLCFWERSKTGSEFSVMLEVMQDSAFEINAVYKVNFQTVYLPITLICPIRWSLHFFPLSASFLCLVVLYALKSDAVRLITVENGHNRCSSIHWLKI